MPDEPSTAGPQPSSMSESNIPRNRGPPPGSLPIICWQLSLNREYTKEEYDACYAVCKTCVEHTKVTYNPRDSDTFRLMMTLMLPLLMMRHRRIPRAKWKDDCTANGKRWIEQAQDNMSAERYMQSMIGYHSLFEGSLCSMIMVQGVKHRVVNIGIGTKQVVVEPKGTTVSAYIESQSHKLTPLEMGIINQDQDDATRLRRFCMIVALKQAYVKAIGHATGFDYSRLEFNVPEQTAIGDSYPLTGWEFRIWKTRLSVARRDQIVHEEYECCAAFFRGTNDSRFIFYDTPEDLTKWVQFINIDQMVKVIPKLTA
ncbi:hypothetical protein H0H92_014957 [Tricholoma furcatifolium]|nr:hypothetical protein H0H92_014957 [Tricholoma furcatifolium]